MKRVVSLLLSAVILLSCLSAFALGASAAESLKLTADKYGAVPGKTVTVKVEVPAGLTGITCRLEYNEAELSVESVKAAGVFGNAAVSRNTGRVGYASAQLTPAKAGTIFTVTFKILKANSTIKAVCFDAEDANNNTISIESASLTIYRFPDVVKGQWYYNPVEYCAEKGFIAGYSDGLFGPADPIQRQDFVVIFARIDGADINAYKNKTVKFKDVKNDAYYAASIAWAVENGVIAGYNPTQFGVGDKITREQVCTIIYRYMGAPAVKNADKTLSAFSDRGRISSFAYNAVAWCVENGVITGKDATTIAPLESASRAQIATIVTRMDMKNMFDN